MPEETAFFASRKSVAAELRHISVILNQLADSVNEELENSGLSEVDYVAMMERQARRLRWLAWETRKTTLHVDPLPKED